MAWRRSEPRDVRPFFGAHQLEKALDHAAIRIRPDADPVRDERIVLALDEFEEAEVCLFPNLAAEDLNSVLGDRAGSYGFVLTLRDPMFMRRVARCVWSLAQELPTSIPIAAEDVHDFGHGRWMELALSLCLLEDRAPEPGWPYVVGSWIARKKFSLGIRSQRSSFQIEPLTEEVRKKNRLPEGTLVFAEVLEPPNEPLEEGATFATCYLAEAILAAMRAHREGPALNAVLEAEIIAALVSAIGRELDDEVTSVSPGSPLSRVLDQLGGGTPMTLESFKALVSDPQRMRAAIHDRVGLVPDLEKL